MNYRIIFNPEARNDLYGLYEYIAGRGFPDRAANYIKRVEEFCLGLRTFPQRGRSFDHLRPGLRMIGFERRISIAFEVVGDAVVIFRVPYGGRDLESLFKAEE